MVGAEEMDSRTVNVRNRDDQSKQSKGELIPLDEMLEKLMQLKLKKSLSNSV